jgi:ATP-dependent helicase HrpB
VRLPIDPLIPEMVRHLRAASNLVIEGAPGAGKTTRVPPALLALDDREILVLEPRRLSARLAARYVSSELGEAIGGTVGYQVRFEDVSGPRTRLRFLTEGVLLRRLLSDPALDRVACVVIDEFHERHLEGDLALALLRRLQRTRRPDLRLVAMSATLDPAPLAKYLGGAHVIRSEGRQYPLEIEYRPHSAEPLEAQVVGALERLSARGIAGHVLVFLPGAAEICRAQNACAPVARRFGWAVLPLHGDQSPEEQDRAVAPSEQPKLILSTNVAESSITIDGVIAVIDSGVARIATHSPWSGLPTLRVARISQAAANQRAGRAGRTRPGHAIRLYPLEDFVRRPTHETPEIERADLAPAALLLDTMGAGRLPDLEWLDAPPGAAVEQAEELLRQLGAQGATGREMASYPLHPRLARLIVEARRRGVAEDGCTAAALLSAGERLPSRPEHATRSDVLALMEAQWSPRTSQVVRQMRRMVNPARQDGRDDKALLMSILAAFPDRVARRRQGRELLLAAGGSAELAPSSTAEGVEFVVAVEAEDRRDQKMPLVRVASGIEPDWLLDLFPSRVRERSEVRWNRSAERVESVSSLMFDAIAIEESRGTAGPEAAATLLAEKAIEAGIDRFGDVAEWEERVRFAGQHGLDSPENPAQDALRALAFGLKSFAELEAATRDGGLLREMERQLPAGTRRALEEVAPAKVRLAGGREAKVHYERDAPPWVQSRLQDFFGMHQTPVVARGKVPVVVRLLAPNHRPVQVTTDLAGFWKRLYPSVRRELMRRYPKHKWPERPV